MTRFGMLIDVTSCTGCYTCVVSCQLGNSLRPGVSWLRVDSIERGAWPDVDRFFFPHACMNCEDPLCVHVCPTGASFKREDGTVGIESDLCIGCSVCVSACEYGARVVNKDDCWYFDAATPAPYEYGAEGRVGIAQKCNFCHERIVDDKEPFCVKSCVCKARIFGDLDDAGSNISRAIKEMQAQQVEETSLYYVLGEHELDLQTYAKSIAQKTAETEMLKTDDRAEGNPHVVTLAGVAAAATAAGLGYTAKCNGDKRKQRIIQEEKEFTESRLTKESLAGNESQKNKRRG